MPKDNVIARAMHSCLKEHGFARVARRTWVRDTSELYHLVNLQGSAFGSVYYVNLGIFVKEISPGIVPRSEVDCHLRARLEDVAGQLWPYRQIELDGGEVPQAEMLQQLKVAIESGALSFFDRVSTADAAADLARSKGFIPVREMVEWMHGRDEN